MIFNDLTGEKSGIINDIDFLVNTDSSSFSLTDKTRLVNRRYEEVQSLIMQSDSRWKWVDTNSASQPIGLINLVDGTQTYAIPDTTYLTVDRVEVKDASGIYFLLIPINEHQIPQALSEYQKVSGRPIYYEKVGGFINLYPKPSGANVTLTSGMKVYYEGQVSYFASTDTTKIPGFAAPFHRILSLGAALDYCLANTILLKSEFITPILQKMENDLITFYSTREKDYQPYLGLRREDYGGSDPLYGSNDGYYRDRVAY